MSFYPLQFYQVMKQRKNQTIDPIIGSIFISWRIDAHSERLLYDNLNSNHKLWFMCARTKVRYSY